MSGASQNNQNTVLSRLGRILIPLALFCLAWTVSAMPVRDFDFWWHLAAGRHIAETGALPDRDPFTEQIGGAGEEARMRTILKGYWLAQTGLYYIYKGFSLGGIVVYKGLVYACVVLLMFMLMRGGGMSPWPSALLLMPFMFPELMEYLRRWTGERPGDLSFVLALLMVYLLERIKEPVLRGERPHSAFLMAPVTVMLFWANVHGGYILGIVLISIYMSEIVLVPLVRRRSRPDRAGMMALGAGGAAILASMLNPNGYGYIIEVFRDITRASASPIQVFEEMSPLTVWSYGVGGSLYAVYYLMALICLAVPVLGRMGISGSLVVAFLAAISFGALRHVEELVFLGYPLVISAWAGLVRERAGRFMPPTRAVAAAVVVIALLAGYMGVQRHIRSDYVIKDVFPVESAGFIRDSVEGGKLFNYYDWGGYLSWALYPRKVFIDGRMNEFMVSRAYASMTTSSDPAAWEMMSSVYGFTAAILPPYSTSWFPVKLFGGIMNSASWAPVFRDDVSVVFLKRNRANAAIINSSEIGRQEILEWVERM